MKNPKYIYVLFNTFHSEYGSIISSFMWSNEDHIMRFCDYIEAYYSGIINTWQEELYNLKCRIEEGNIKSNITISGILDRIESVERTIFDLGKSRDLDRKYIKDYDAHVKNGDTQIFHPYTDEKREYGFEIRKVGMGDIITF